MKYLTADLHFFHGNIIKYCNRPFKNMVSMNNALIDNINSLVLPSDELYILGDIGFFEKNNPNKLKKMMHRINCQRIYLILGNHDDFKPFSYLSCGFSRVHTSVEVISNKYTYELIHDPSLSQIDRSKLFLCGHVHDLFVTCKSNVLNVGVDVFNYKPLSLDEVDFIVDKAIENGDIILK